MADYIKREAAFESMACLARQNFSLSGDFQQYLEGLKDADIRIRSIPAANVRPVVRGKWRLGGYGQISDATVKWYDKFLQGCFFYCSVCKKRSSAKTNFCPNCGADMRKEVTNG